MYKFADVKPKAEVVNDYYRLEQIQIDLMQLVSANNLHNEMILKFIGQLEEQKAKFNKFKFDFTKNLDQNKAEF